MHEDPPSSQSLPSSSSFFSRLIYFLFSSFISFAFLDLLPSGQCLPNFLRRLLPPRELYGASEKANATEGRMETKRWIYQYLYLLTPLRFVFIFVRRKRFLHLAFSLSWCLSGFPSSTDHRSFLSNRMIWGPSAVPAAGNNETKNLCRPGPAECASWLLTTSCRRARVLGPYTQLLQLYRQFLEQSTNFYTVYLAREENYRRTWRFCCDKIRWTFCMTFARDDTSQ